MGTMHAELKFECPKCHKKFCKKGMLDMHLKMRKFDCADGSKVEGYKWPPGQTSRGPRQRKQNPLSTTIGDMEPGKMELLESETKEAVDSINSYQW